MTVKQTRQVKGLGASFTRTETRVIDVANPGPNDVPTTDPVSDWALVAPATPPAAVPTPAPQGIGASEVHE